MEEPKNEYEKLLKQIDELPKTETENNVNLQKKLREYVIEFMNINEKVESQYLGKEELNELRKELMKKTLDFLGMVRSFNTVWGRYKSHSSEFHNSFGKASRDTITVLEKLKEKLKEQEKAQRKLTR